MKHVLIVDIPNDEIEEFDRVVRRDPSLLDPHGNTQFGQVTVALQRALRDRDQTDHAGQVPIVEWLTSRPLRLDDEWIDDSGTACRLERYADEDGNVLISWTDTNRRFCGRRAPSEVVGQKRADGSLIGPTVVTA